MNDTDFFSSNAYLFLPTKQNPKVALAIDNSVLAHNAFKLYNPFSKKAQVLKKSFAFLVVNINALSQMIFSIKKEKSKFIEYLEKKLDQKLIVSLYFATANDKVVLQLQTKEAEIVGYVKYPVNEKGLKHIENEIKAFDILSSKKIIKPYILRDRYESKPFLLLKELDGTIGIVEHDYALDLLKKFKRNKYYTLTEHPRIISLKKILSEHNILQPLEELETICNHSIEKYELVYEHGDFAPWNIVKVDNRYMPFDFEYFVEEGLEYFDLIKYYYQIGSLLEGKVDNELKEFVCSKINILEIDELYQLYLIKERLMKRLENI